MERAPAWSPDGRWIAFAAARTKPYPPGSREDQIYVTRADGTGRRQLTEPPAGDGTTFATDPTWSPDGRRIVFTSNRSGGPPEVHAMAPDGSGVVVLMVMTLIDSRLSPTSRAGEPLFTSTAPAR